MSYLKKLRDAKTRSQIADILGFKLSQLTYILYRLPDSAKYTSFNISKRTGGVRKIKAPIPSLALLQRRLANVLYLCLDEIDSSKAGRRSLAHAFERNRSIVTNASLHKHRRYVLNLDLEDFFPSINFGRVRGFFLKDKYFALDATVATILSQIACSENELPQGSPCSPVISNLIGHMLDARLARFAKSNKCTYSRYADDITFSTNQREFPSELATPDAAEPFKWRLGDPLASKIENSDFRVNHSKTRMQFRGSRQVITGLLVNEKVNIRPEYYRTVRSMCHELFNRGESYRMMPAGLMGGLPTDAAVKVSTTRTDQLNGMLAHVHYVKGYAARQQDTKNKNQEKDPAAATLYEKFLFYKNFVALSAPLVIPEGKTDPIYVRMAIAKLGAYHGRLAQILDGKLSPTLRFLRATRTVHELLKVGNGTGGMPMFISTYKDRLKRYRHKPLLHPVILLIDNDDGASKVFGPARSASGAKIDHTTKDPFYYLWANLYLVKTPELGAKGTSRMEDFFDKAVLATAVDGKTFDPDKDHDEPGKYGKVVFAEKVVKPNADTIDFSKFAPLLERIVAVLDDYDKRKAIPLTI